MSRFIVPTFISFLGILSAFCMIHSIVHGRYINVLYFMMLCCIIDYLDGFVARKINAVSQLGGYIDSLCDVFCFGVAPILTIYFWFLIDLGNIGVIISFILLSCLIFRLARFNVIQDAQEKIVFNTDTTKYFIGVPAPMFAILLIFPFAIFIYFAPSVSSVEDLDYFTNYFSIDEYKKFPLYLVFLVYWLFIAFLAVSKLPIISPKNFKIGKVFYMIAIFGLILYFYYPVEILNILCIASFGIILTGLYKKLLKNHI